MFNHESISDLENLIISNQQNINNHQDKILELKQQNMIYQKHIKLKKKLKTIKILKIVKDKSWDDTTIHLSVIDFSADETNEVNLHSSCRLPWKQRGNIEKIIKLYYEDYPDIKKIVSIGYPLSKKIRDTYHVEIINN